MLDKNTFRLWDLGLYIRSDKRLKGLFDQYRDSPCLARETVTPTILAGEAYDRPKP